MVLQQKGIVEAVGWIGAAASLSAFSLNSMNVIGSQSIQYLLLNILGCFCLIVYAVFKKAHASWVLNSIWLLMTVVALVKVYILR
jgi:hypothetical protein